MLKLDGVNKPDFLKIQRVNIQLLPDIDHNINNLPGRDGVLLGKTRLGAKIITAPFVIVIPKNKSLQECGRELASWLFSRENKKLIITDDPGIYYSARINNASELSDLIYAGEGTLEFIVPSGVAEGVALIQNNGIVTTTVNYIGSAEGLPEIVLELPSAVADGIHTILNVKTGVKHSFKGAFAAGTIITFNNKDSSVKVNGAHNKKILTFDNEIIKLMPGTNEIKSSIAGSKITVKYNNCWI